MFWDDETWNNLYYVWRGDIQWLRKRFECQRYPIAEASFEQCKQKDHDW